MISQSDLANPATSLDSLAGTIDDGIRQNPFFISHDGESLLALSNASTSPTLTGSSLNQSGSIT